MKVQQTHNPLKSVNLTFPILAFGLIAGFCAFKIITGHQHMESWRLICFAIGGSILFASSVFLIFFQIKHLRKKTANSYKNWRP